MFLLFWKLFETWPDLNIIPKK